jgi:hypothetical protein
MAGYHSFLGQEQPTFQLFYEQRTKIRHAAGGHGSIAKHRAQIRMLAGENKNGEYKIILKNVAKFICNYMDEGTKASLRLEYFQTLTHDLTWELVVS